MHRSHAPQPILETLAHRHSVPRAQARTVDPAPLRSFVFTGLSLLFLFLAAGCSAGAGEPLRVSVPSELELSADHLTVEGRGNTGVWVHETFRYGDWVVDDVHRGPREGRGNGFKIRSTDWRTLVADWSSFRRYGRTWYRGLDDGRDVWVNYQRGFSFSVTRDDARWEGECNSELQEAGGPQQELLQCILRPTDSDEVWVLAADLWEQWDIETAFESGGTQLEGILTNDDAAFLMTSTGQVERLPFAVGIAGFVFTEDERTLAAVQTLEDGAVWMPREQPAEHRDALAAAAAALLLYDPIEGDV